MKNINIDFSTAEALLILKVSARFIGHLLSHLQIFTNFAQVVVVVEKCTENNQVLIPNLLV